MNEATPPNARPPGAGRPLSADDLLRGGALSVLGRQVLVFDEVDSTNSALRKRAAELPDGTIAHAELQSAGRGRQGRRWETPRGAGVLLSVLLHEPAATPLRACAAMFASVALCEAVESIAALAPGVRWPNDVTLAGRKLAGVLVESTRVVRAAAASQSLVIGIGLNCLQQRGHFAGELAQRAISLEIASPRPVDRAAVAAALVARLDAWVARLRTEAGAAADVRRAWRQRSADIGGHVRLRQADARFAGTVIDVDESGDLVVQLSEGGRAHFGAATTTREW